MGVEVETPSPKSFKISSSISEVLYDWDDEKLEDYNSSDTAGRNAGSRKSANGGAGHDLDRVFDKMDSLRSELKQEQQRASGLKKALVLVCGLAALLAVSNVSTSLVAVRVASNANSSPTLSSNSVQQMIAASPKYYEVKMEPIKDDDIRRLNPSRRRHLEQSRAIACGRGGVGPSFDSESTTGESNGQAVCQLMGKISYDDAVHLYQQFCPPWPFTVTTTDGDGTSTTTSVANSCMSNGGVIPGAYINCGDHITYIKGGIHFPSEHPGEIDGGVSAYKMRSLRRCRRCYIVPDLLRHCTTIIANSNVFFVFDCCIFTVDCIPIGTWWSISSRINCA